MIEVIDGSKPVEGYVLEKETETTYALVHYQFEANRYVPTVEEIIDADELIDAYVLSHLAGKSIEQHLRKMILKDIDQNQNIYIRKEENLSLEDVVEDEDKEN